MDMVYTKSILVKKEKLVVILVIMDMVYTLIILKKSNYGL